MMATVFACVPIIIIFLKGEDFKMLESFHQPPPSPHQHCVVWPEFQDTAFAIWAEFDSSSLCSLEGAFGGCTRTSRQQCMCEGRLLQVLCVPPSHWDGIVAAAECVSHHEALSVCLSPVQYIWRSASHSGAAALHSCDIHFLCNAGRLLCILSVFVVSAAQPCIF